MDPVNPKKNLQQESCFERSWLKFQHGRSYCKSRAFLCKGWGPFGYIPAPEPDEKRLVLRVEKLEEQRSLQISIAKPIASEFQLFTHQEVIIEHADPKNVGLDFVHVHFKDNTSPAVTYGAAGPHKQVRLRITKAIRFGVPRESEQIAY